MPAAVLRMPRLVGVGGRADRRTAVPVVLDFIAKLDREQSRSEGVDHVLGFAQSLFQGIPGEVEAPDSGPVTRIQKTTKLFQARARDDGVLRLRAHLSGSGIAGEVRDDTAEAQDSAPSKIANQAQVRAVAFAQQPEACRRGHLVPEAREVLGDGGQHEACIDVQVQNRIRRSKGPCCACKHGGCGATRCRSQDGTARRIGEAM